MACAPPIQIIQPSQNHIIRPALLPGTRSTERQCDGPIFRLFPPSRRLRLGSHTPHDGPLPLQRGLRSDQTGHALHVACRQPGSCGPGRSSGGLAAQPPAAKQSSLKTQKRLRTQEKSSFRNSGLERTHQASCSIGSPEMSFGLGADATKILSSMPRFQYCCMKQRWKFEHLCYCCPTWPVTTPGVNLARMTCSVVFCLGLFYWIEQLALALHSSSRYSPAAPPSWLAVSVRSLTFTSRLSYCRTIAEGPWPRARFACHRHILAFSPRLSFPLIT